MQWLAKQTPQNGTSIGNACFLDGHGLSILHCRHFGREHLARKSADSQSMKGYCVLDVEVFRNEPDQYECMEYGCGKVLKRESSFQILSLI